MIRGNVLHYVERDGEREVHIIPDGGVFDVYFVKGKNCCLSYMFGLPKHQPCENTDYDLEDAFRIAWANFSRYEEMIDDEEL